jgi:hypothetical protein
VPTAGGELTQSAKDGNEIQCIIPYVTRKIFNSKAL